MFKTYLILLGPIFSTVIAQILLKRGISDLGALDFSLANLISLIPRILQNIWLMGGAFVFGIGFLIYLFVLSKLQLNVAYPITVSSAIIIVSLASWFLFRETLGWLQILGIVSIIFGIFLLTTKG